MDDNIITKFNVFLLGKTTVGKTSLVQSFVGESFDENRPATIGVDSVFHKAIIDGKEFIFKIFDNPGIGRYDSIISPILKFADGFLLVFSVDNKKTLKKINEWMII